MLKLSKKSPYTKDNILDIYALKAYIYILGLNSEGESIVFLLKANEEVIFSAVVDSFLYNKQIACELILAEHNVKNLDYLFWSHPHVDHSKGIIQLINKYKPKHIVKPAELLDEIGTEELDKIHRFINGFNAYDRRKKLINVPEVETVACNTILEDKSFSLKNNQEASFYIRVIAPISGIVNYKRFSDKQYKLNDYSIVLSIGIGRFHIMLTGDVQDNVLSYVTEKCNFYLPKPDIVKVPHHCSKYSLTFTDLFDDEIECAVTTCKRRSGLPDDAALSHYIRNSKELYGIERDCNKIAVFGIELDIINSTKKLIKTNGYALIRAKGYSEGVGNNEFI